MGIALRWEPSDQVTWSRDIFLLCLDVVCLIYTRLYFVLHPLELTVAPSVFMNVTRPPRPCGLSRTSAMPA